MKFSQDGSTSPFAISSYGPGRIVIGGEVHTASLLVSPRELVRDWPPQGFAELQTAHFERIVALAPELVLLGSGVRLRFPAPALTAPLHRRNIGLEVMDTGAACRTFNLLLAEGRQVVAALLPTVD